MTIAVCSTLAAFAMRDEDIWGAWLYNAVAMKDSHPDGVTFFAAIEVDARGEEPFHPLMHRLNELGGEWWTFMLDDGRTEVTTGNRLRHICMGQNLCSDYASSPGITHMLFLAADCCPPADAIPKLLEVDYPYVGGHVSTYCLDGIRAIDPRWEGMDIRTHMPTAAFMLLRRDVYKRLRWRWDIETGESDDPAYWRDARELLGVEAVVRHDVVGRHFPEAIGPIESRGHDLKVHRKT